MSSTHQVVTVIAVGLLSIEGFAGFECGEPAAGHCCEANGTPACDDADCCTLVCGLLPVCCDVEWDSICASVALELCTPCQEPVVIYVDDDCPGTGDGTALNPYCSIQTAIYAATHGDEVVVGPGTYFETINLFGKAISVHSSDGPEVTVIDGTGSFDPVVRCASGEGPETVLEGFTITHGSASFGGMDNTGSSPTVTHCMFIENFGLGMSNTSSNPTVTHCTFSSNSGVGMRNSTSSPTVTDCTFGDNGAGGMQNWVNSNPIVTSCTFSGNQDSGMRNSISSPTVINCSFSDNSAFRGGGMLNGGSSSPTVTGCTFSGNNAADSGGGMGNFDSNPTVTDCMFAGNTADIGGGMYDSNSHPTVTSCTFTGNAAALSGGGMRNSFSSPAVIDCSFDANSALGGGGMFNGGSSSPTVTGCTFIENVTIEWGGGMGNFSGSPTVTSCTFSGNIASDWGGGMGSFSSSPTVINCTFVANTTSIGGGMYHDNSSPTVTNCVFSANIADEGRAVAFDSASPCCPSELVMANCILWNGGSEIWNNDGSTITINYSNVQGGFPGLGNIDAEPMFVDPGNGDLRLSPGSPGIDAGNNWGVSPDLADLDADGETLELTPRDLDGNPRFAGDGNDLDPGCGEPVVVDMGAYERPGASFNVVFGDLNGNGTVGVLDLAILTACLGSDEAACCVADLNLDGTVGIIDMMLLGSSMVDAVPVAVP